MLFRLGVNTAELANSAVTEDIVAASAITETKVADDAITTPKITAGAVTANEIAAATITGNKIVANTITGGLLATSGIITNSAQINDATIVDAKFTGTLSANKIKIDNVTLDTDGSNNLIIKNSGVDTTQIADNAVSIRGEYQATSFTGIISNSTDKYLLARVNSFTLTETSVVEFAVSTLVSRGGVGDLQLRYNTSAYGTPSYTTTATPTGTAFASYGTSIDIHGDSTSDARGEPTTVILRQSLSSGTYHFAVYGGRSTGSVQYRGMSAMVKVIKR